MGQPNNVVELLRDLVAIPSVNPHGVPGTDRTGEAELARYVADFLRDCGAEVAVEEVQPGRPNVLAAFAPERPAAAHLAFAPHLDTVSVAGMTIPPFDPAVRDGKLWGRGSTDTKGPMAAALWALRDWARGPERAASAVRWSFLALMGEEAGNEGAHVLAGRKFACDLMMVLEPTDLAVVTAQKGVLWFEVEVPGLACHGSTPERGRNAIHEMGEVLRLIREELIPLLGREPHPELGPTTLNVGTIAGGSKINIVPDFCRIEVDCRFLPAHGPGRIEAVLREALRQAAPEAELKVQRSSPPLETDAALPWVRRLGEAAGRFATSAWYSDAAILSAPDCPSVCLGPGRIAQAHTRDEFIAVADLEAGAAFFRRWIAAAERATAGPASA